MRIRLLLLIAVLSPHSSWAQGDEPADPVTEIDAGARATAHPKTAALPAADGGVPVATLPSESAGPVKPADLEAVQKIAHQFFADLLYSDARNAVRASAFPFTLETRVFAAPDELLNEWLRQLRAKRIDLLTLYGVEVLTPAELEKKYGKPPARLAQFPWRNGKTLIAVANISGHGAMAVFRSVGTTWRAIAYHD